MDIALIATGSLVIVATLLPLLRSEVWWIRIFDFPRVQIALIGVSTLVTYLYLRDGYDLAGTLFTAALVLCLARLAYVIYPYTSLARTQVQQSKGPGIRLAMLCANLLMTNRNAARLCRIIKEVDPDIILVVEADDWWQQQLRDFEATHPFIVHQPQDNTYGMLLYSRFELVNVSIDFLVEDTIPSIHAVAKLPTGLEVELFCLHPRPPFPTEDESSTDRDAELLLVGKSIKGTVRPTVVFGDLNDVAWSRSNYLFQDISGLLDPRIGRGLFNTFHAKYFFLRFPLDHFFHTNDFRLLDFRRLAQFGSDHFPVYIKLSYEPEASVEQEEPNASAAQEREAREKIGKAQGLRYQGGWEARQGGVTLECPLYFGRPAGSDYA